MTSPGPAGNLDIRYCASCRKVIRKAEEIGGACAVCDQLVCAECAQHTCAKCGEISCRKESIRTLRGDICRAHSVMEMIILVPFGGGNAKRF